jgi:predicted dehydrogenase
MSHAWIDYAVKRADIDICGLADVTTGRADACRERYSLNCGTYADFNHALHALKPDVVFDITVPEAHFSVTSAALRAGCHVFGEKPMAADLESARAIVRIADESGKTYAVMQNRRYSKPIRDYKELLNDKCVGRLAAINADFYLGAHFGGFRDLMDSPLILDMAIHTFDMARFLCEGNAVSAFCHESNPPWSWYRGAANAVCVFEMDNGCVFSYRGSWCAEGCPTEWEADWRSVGEHGSAVWKSAGDIYAELVSDPHSGDFIRPVKRVYPQGSWEGGSGHEGCLDAMFAAISKNTMPETGCRDNIHSMEMVFGALESARAGQKVRISHGNSNG